MNLIVYIETIVHGFEKYHKYTVKNGEWKIENGEPLANSTLQPNP